MLIYHLKQLIRDILLLAGNPFGIVNFSPQHKCLIGLGPFDSLVHIGANTGQEMATYEFMAIPHVVWIEADPRALRWLRFRNFIYRSRGQILEGLVDEVSGKEVDFYLMSQSGASSMFRPTGVLGLNSKMRVRGNRKMTTKSADEILIENHLILNGTNNCLVLDVQGAEYKVLKGFKRHDLVKFKTIMFETAPNLYDAPNEESEIKNLLVNLGYEETFTPLRSSWDDVIFTRVE